MEHSDGQLIEEISDYNFEETLARLEAAITSAGLIVFARIDHARGAREFGMEMPSATVLIYGHPRGGTPIMLEHPRAALDLPLKLLVWEKPDGKAAVLYRPIASVLAPAGVPADQALRLAPAQKLIGPTIGAR